MKLTYFGHSCFSVETSGKTLLFDPFVTPNSLASAVNVDEIRADLILISHGHFDHIADAVAIAKRTGALVVANFEICEWLGKQGLEKLQPMNHGGEITREGFTVKMTSAIHSSVLPDGTYGGNPGGFVVKTGDDAFYYSGDTALTLDMKLVAEEFALRFAVLPIGNVFTMGIQDAIRAARFVGCKDVVGVHYDTFPPIQIDKQSALESFGGAGLRLHLPPIGEGISLKD